MSETEGSESSTGDVTEASDAGCRDDTVRSMNLIGDLVEPGYEEIEVPVDG